MPTYMLRQIDHAIWDRVQAQAKKDGLPLREVFLKLLTLYGQGQIVITIGPQMEGKES